MTQPPTHALTDEQYLALLRQAHLGAVAATALHEFNNLATPMLMRAQDALDRNDATAMRQTAESVQRNLQKGLDLCRHLLSLLNPPLEGVESVPLVDVVADALGALGRPLEKDRIEVRREIPASLRVRVNCALFEQLLIHLLTEMKTVVTGRGARLFIKAAEEVATSVLQFECGGERCTPQFVAENWTPWLDSSSPLPPLIGSTREFALRACRSIAAAHGIEISVAAKEPFGCTIQLRLNKSNE